MDQTCKLNPNSWHARLLKSVLGVKATEITNLCPYFWLTLYACIRYPLRKDGVIKKTTKSLIKESKRTVSILLSLFLITVGGALSILTAYLIFILLSLPVKDTLLSVIIGVSIIVVGVMFVFGMMIHVLSKPTEVLAKYLKLEYKDFCPGIEWLQ